MQLLNLKNCIIKECTCLLYVLLLVCFNVQGQSCTCTNCDNSVGPLSNSTFEFLAEGALANDLSDPAQAVCGVEIDFIPDHIWSLEMTLTSPGGQSITLIGSQSFQIGVTGPLTWSIGFVPCAVPANPDPGFNDTWDNNQNWLLANPYSGDYYPHIGCLEDFNTGTVDGSWTLTVDNAHPLSSVQIIDFNVIFCDPEGLDCFVCEADAGTLDNTDVVKACEGDSSLILEVNPLYQVEMPDTSLYGYTYVIAMDDTIVGYSSIPDLSSYPSGLYTVCGMSFLLEDSLSLPLPGEMADLSELVDNLESDNPNFCASITDLCIDINIVRSETVIIEDTICLGDTLFVDTLQLTETGIYQLDYSNQLACDSTLIIDLTVQAPVISLIQDTVCAEEAYFFNGEWLEESGNYEDTLLTTAGCDSLVFLKFFRLDTIIVEETAIICQGDSFLLGNTYYYSNGVYDETFSIDGACDSTVRLDLIVLDPQIIVAPVPDLDCNNSTILVDASGSLGEAITFEWIDLVNGGAGISGASDEAILEVSLPGNYLLTIRDTLGGNNCDVSTMITVGTDYTDPVINTFDNTIDCVNPPVQIQTDAITSITDYSWSGPGAFNSSAEDPWVSLPGLYTVTVTGTNGCTAIFDATVNADTLAPLITSASVSDTLTCNNTSVQLLGNANDPSVAYHWGGPNGFDESISNPFTSTPGLYTFTIQANNGCISDTSITVFQNIEAPVVQIQNGILGCPPDTIQLFSSSSIPGSTFSWLGPNGFTSNEQNPLITEAGFYGLTATAPNGCSALVFTNVTANTQVPFVTIVGDTLGCNEIFATLGGTSNINGSAFSWEGPGGFSASGETIMVSIPGIYTLNVEAPNGCQSSETFELIEDTQTPNVTLLGQDTLGCFPDTISLFAFADIMNVDYEWLGPNGFISLTNNAQITAPGLYQLTVTASNACDTVLFYEVLQDDETPVISIVVDDTLNCAPDTVVLQSFSSIAGSTFNWQGPNGYTSNLSNPLVTEGGNYELTVIAPNGCETVSNVEVLSDETVPVVSIITDTLGCAPDTVELQSFSNIAGSTFNWQGPNGYISDMSNPLVTEGGNYELTVTAPNGCETVSNVEVYSNETVPVVSIITDTLGCAPDTVELQSFSSISGSTYSWQGPNGYTSDMSNPLITEGGNYELTVTAPNGCETVSNVEVLSDETLPIVSIITDTLGCSPDTVELQSFSSISGSTFNWQGPNAYTSDISNPLVIESGDYELTVVAPNGCETVSNIEVLSDETVPVVSIITDTLGCAPDTVELQSFSNIAGSTFNWEGPNGYTSNLSNPLVTEGGNYELRVIAPNGCETVSNVEVYSDETIPVVSIITDTLGCAPDTVELQSFSNISGSTYSWQGPNGYTSDISDPLVTEGGDYELTVIAPNGCETVSTIEILSDETIPVVSIITDTLGCAPDTIELQSFSNISSSSFNWQGPNGYTSDMSNPLVTEGGHYELTVVAPNGCEAVSTIEVLSDETIPVVLIITDTLGCSPDTIELQSFSNISGSTYSWQGPNGYTSDMSNPLVTEGGNYELTVVAPNGCETVSTIEVLSDETVPVVSIITDTLGCAPDTVELQSFSNISGSTYSWQGPNGYTSDISNPLVTEGGNYELTVVAPNGCEAISIIEVLSDETIPVVSIITDTLGCAPDTVELQSFSNISGSTYSWQGPNGYTSDISNPLVTESGDYELTVVAPNGCETVSTIEVLSDETVPVVSILTDTLGCSPDTVELQSFSNITGSTFNWQGPNGYTSDMSNPLVTESGDYELTVTAPNGCEIVSTVEVLSDETVPLVSIITDTLGCSPDTVELQSFSSISGSTYSWQGPNGYTSDMSNPLVMESGDYELTVVAPNGCETISTIEVLSDETVPVVSIITDTLGCAPDTVELQSFSSISGSTYSWQGPNGYTSDMSNPLVMESGDYELTVIAPNGCETVSTIEVLSDETVPVVSIITDTLGCSPDTIELQSFSSISGSTYSWQGPNGYTSDISNPLVLEGGDYELTVTAPNGCEAISNVEVLSDETVPEISIQGDTINCLHDTIILSAIVNENDLTFEWFGPDGFIAETQSIAVAATGVYDLQIRANNACVNMDSFQVIADLESPAINAIGDTIDCTNNPLFLQGQSNVNNAEFAWSGPGNFFSAEQNPFISEAGIYQLTLTAPNGCIADTSVLVIDLSDAIIADALVNDTLDCETTEVSIDGSNSSAGNFISYEWLDENNSTIGNNLFITVGEAGIYTLVVSDSNTSCSDTTQVSIVGDTINPDANITVLGAQSITCNNESVILSSNGSTPPDNISINWFLDGNPFSNVSDIEVTEAGAYILQITNELNQCTATDTAFINQNTELPEINISLPDTLDCLHATVEINASNSSSGSEFLFSWTGENPGSIVNGANTLILTVDGIGLYTLTITNTLNGCLDSASVSVLANLEYPVAQANPAEFLDCFNQMVSLDGTGSSVGNQFEYQWTGGNIISGDNSLMPMVNETGWYTLNVLNIQNGCLSAAQVLVEGNDNFITNAEIDFLPPSCFNEDDGFISITNIAGGNAPYTYFLNDESFSISDFANLQAGVYNLSILDAEGCVLDTVITLENPVEPSLYLGEDQLIQLGDSVFLDPQSNISFLDLDTFYWTEPTVIPCDTCFYQWVKPYDATNYQLTIIDQNGCIANDEILLRVKKDRLVFIPNIFTPNDDGVNDLFKIYTGQDVASVNTFKIFDRWGELVFEKNDFNPNDQNTAWDGTLDGNPLNPAVFVYLAEITFLDGRVEIYSGDFTLAR